MNHIMNTKIILIASSMLLITVYAFPQLKVANDGNVGIALSETVTPLSNLSIGAAGQSDTRLYLQKGGIFADSQYGIQSKMTTFVTNAWSYAIAGITTGASKYSVGVKGESTAQSPIGGLLASVRAYGVYGAAGGAKSGRNYGVYGLLQVGKGDGAAIYGTNDGVEHIITGRYAGFFRGQTKVNGDFYATTVNTTSDMRLKTNISDVEYNTIAKLWRLHPVQFLWKQQNLLKSCDDSQELLSASISSDIDTEQLHYGFIAQEVQKMFPELVHEDEEGYLSINYVELIPLLVQSMQELSDEVAALKGNNTKRVPKKENNLLGSTDVDDIHAVLFQNNPNPFTTETKIHYILPTSTKSAVIYIYNMNGLQISEFPIESFGEGNVSISAGTLDAGMYLYSLIADEKIIDTKRMILTK